MGDESDTSGRNNVCNTPQTGSELLEPSNDSDTEKLMADGYGFDRIEERQESYQKLQQKYERLLERHVQTQDQLKEEILEQQELVISEYGDAMELLKEIDDAYDELGDEYHELQENYHDIADKLVYTLDDFADARRNHGTKDVAQGVGLIGAGILAADLYSFGGAFDFYANAISNYANEPATMILTLGLPLLGAAYLTSAASSWNESRELRSAAEEWRERRAEMEFFEPTKPDNIERVDRIDFD